jgi:hypothetical protein
LTFAEPSSDLLIAFTDAPAPATSSATLPLPSSRSCWAKSRSNGPTAMPVRFSFTVTRLPLAWAPSAPASDPS